MTDGARTFQAPPDAYEAFMGAWSRRLADAFVSFVGVARGDRVLDVGCGTGALTTALVDHVGDGSVAAVDPSSSLVAACTEAAPTADVRHGDGESLPFDDGSFDVSMAQLVVNFMADAPAGVREMRRVTRPGGTVAACTWDLGDGMTMLRVFWDAASALDPAAPHEARTMSYCDESSLTELWRGTGIGDVRTGELVVTRTYEDFDHYWGTFELGVGPGGAYCRSLEPDQRLELRDACFRLLGRPSGPMPMTARAWAVVGIR